MTMIYNLTIDQYNEINVASRQINSKLKTIYIDVVHSIISKYGASLSKSETQCLIFIVDRTLYYSQISATISGGQFETGMRKSGTGEIVFSGLGINKATRLKTLRQLEEKNLIHVGRVKENDNAPESLPRIYSANIATIIGVAYADEDMPLKMKSGEAENRAILPVSESPHLSSYRRKRKIILIGGRPAEGDTFISTSLVDRKSDAESLLPQYKHKFVPVEDMQAAINSLIDEHHPKAGYPLVTEKALGTYFKKIRAASIDSNAFLRYIFRNWFSIVEKQRFGLTKVLDKKITPLPTVPNFDEIAFRFSYFQKCFATHQGSNGLNNFIADGEILREENRTLRRRLKFGQEENQSLTKGYKSALRTVRKLKDTSGAPNIPMLKVPRTDAEIDELINDRTPLPTWDELDKLGVSRPPRKRR